MKQHFILIVFSAIIATFLITLVIKVSNPADAFEKMVCETNAQTEIEKLSCNTPTS